MRIPRRHHGRWLFAGCCASAAAQATVYPLPPPGTNVIGQMQVVNATKEDTLVDIARRYGLGYDEIVHANPGVDRWAPEEGTPIVIPTQHVLPNTPREGIVLNIPEMRVYYYPQAAPGEPRNVYTYPVSIGRMDWKTPLGVTKVVAKEVDPPWRPPASIKAEHAKEGDILPDIVPGGPDNPLGRFAMRLGIPGYLIHSTNKPYGIGMRVTHGCMRMYPEDVKDLYYKVPVGTPVRLVDQAVKVGNLKGALMVQSHQPLEEDELPMKVTMDHAKKTVMAAVGEEMPGVDQAALALAVEQSSGIPVEIGTVPEKGLFADAAPEKITPSVPASTASAAPEKAVEQKSDRQDAVEKDVEPAKPAAPTAFAAPPPRPVDREVEPPRLAPVSRPSLRKAADDKPTEPPQLSKAPPPRLVKRAATPEPKPATRTPVPTTVAKLSSSATKAPEKLGKPMVAKAAPTPAKPAKPAASEKASAPKPTAIAASTKKPAVVEKPTSAKPTTTATAAPTVAKKPAAAPTLSQQATKKPPTTR